MSLQDHHDQISQTLSRRNFLKCVGASLIVAALAALEPQFAWAQEAALLSSMADWEPATFASQAGQSFTVNGGLARDVRLRLVQVQDGIARIYRGPQNIVTAPAGDCFVLVFHGPREPALAQSTYQFAHPYLGKFPLFITPGKTSPQGQNYEAIINHVHA